MTPEFAYHVDPIFVRVFNLLDAIDTGQETSPEDQRRMINDDLRNADVGLHEQRAVWRLAKFALVYWIDEVLRSIQWSGRSWWEQEPLEWHHFKEAHANEYFYIHAREAADAPELEDALETFYACFMLGFRGVYRDEERQKETFPLTVKRYDLPDTPDEWASRMSKLIAQRRKRLQSAAEDHTRERKPIVTAKPLWRRDLVFWPWLLFVLVAGLTVTVLLQSQ